MTGSSDSSPSNDHDETKNDSSEHATHEPDSHVSDDSNEVCKPSDEFNSKDEETLKRKGSETETFDKPFKLKKSDISDTPSFLDIIKSVVWF
uniref:Uncharacterized protein n=1 Tax=Theileria parva TaxID=5875 RepID=Q4N3P1_THEPA|eukprot:XP_765515.1 hypothetical protein [Theileria parva strain Muguga]